ALSPLGSGALAGTTLPLDRAATARALGFAGPSRNSMDAVASRDAGLEFLAAGAIAQVHLSRLAEELVLWSTAEFGFIELADAYSTGSSLVPPEKNPHGPRLGRGKAGPRGRQPRRAAHRAEGPAAHLQPRSPGGQGADLRHGAHAARLARGDRGRDRHAARRRGAHAPGRERSDAARHRPRRGARARARAVPRG